MARSWTASSSYSKLDEQASSCRLTLVQHDNRPPIELEAIEEAGVLKGIAEIEAGKGIAAARLRKKLRRR